MTRCPSIYAVPWKLKRHRFTFDDAPVTNFHILTAEPEPREVVTFAAWECPERLPRHIVRLHNAELATAGEVKP